MVDKNSFLNMAYDILAQNDTSVGERDYITSLIDHVDNDNSTIVFKLDSGVELELRLMSTYSPSEEASI